MSSSINLNKKLNFFDSIINSDPTIQSTAQSNTKEELIDETLVVSGSKKLKSEESNVNQIDFLNFETIQHLIFENKNINISYAEEMTIKGSILDPDYNSLLFLTKTEVEEILKNGGVLTKIDKSKELINHHILVLKSEKAKKPQAMIYFTINESNARIEVVMIHGGEGKGYASILLCAALAIIHKNKCTKVTLTSTEEGAYLYALFGFRPARGIMPKELWNNLPYIEKVRIIIENEHDRYFSRPKNERGCFLDLNDPETRSLVQSRFEKILSNEKKVSIDPLDASTINIPQVAFDFKILDADHVTAYSHDKE